MEVIIINLLLYEAIIDILYGSNLYIIGLKNHLHTKIFNCSLCDYIFQGMCLTSFNYSSNFYRNSYIIEGIIHLFIAINIYKGHIYMNTFVNVTK